MATVVLAVVIFLLDNLEEKRSLPLTKQSGVAYFKSSCSIAVENPLTREMCGLINVC